MLAFTLLLSVAALAAGFLLFASRRDVGPLGFAVDGFALGAVPTLLAVDIVPHLWVRFGAFAPCLIAVGYVLVGLSERALESKGLRARVVLGVLALHSLIDGASLAFARKLPSGRAGAVLAAAVVVHRLPEGFVVGALFAPRQGLRVAAAGAGVLALATVAGGLGGRELLDGADASVAQFAVALAMGALLRAVLHGHEARSRPRLAARAIGAVLGAALALSLPDP